ncbi:MAG: hypothetical protein P4L74_06460 [Candidatus Doudnabacteria bacterium]|nr:hypothetical protein [Candidatus Doudnabacteria bacterium]
METQTNKPNQTQGNSSLRNSLAQEQEARLKTLDKLSWKIFVPVGGILLCIAWLAGKDYSSMIVTLGAFSLGIGVSNLGYKIFVKNTGHENTNKRLVVLSILILILAAIFFLGATFH